MSKNLFICRAWRKTIKGHLALARISNSPTVLSNTLAGVVLANARWFDGRTGLVAIAMVLFYTAGMYLNDLLDYAHDCRDKPERPLPAGKVSRVAATIGVLTFFCGGCLLLGYACLRPFLCGLLLITLIIFYDQWHKHNPFSLLLMALCRGMVYVTAFLSFNFSSLFDLLIPLCLLVSYVLGLSAFARQEDEKGQIRNMVLVVLLLLPEVYSLAHFSPLSLLMGLFFTVWVLYSISFAFRAKHWREQTVGQLIAGIALLDGLIMAVAGCASGIVLALGAFGLTLYLQRYVKGT
jgi:hypothetical protein